MIEDEREIVNPPQAEGLTGRSFQPIVPDMNEARSIDARGTTLSSFSFFWYWTEPDSSAMG